MVWTEVLVPINSGWVKDVREKEMDEEARKPVMPSISLQGVDNSM